jgi:VanZ family protein
MAQTFRALFWFACAAIGVLSLAPIAHLPPELSGWWDKLQHVAAFAALALLGCLAHPDRTPRVAIGLLGFGVLIEVAQQASGWRFGEVGDWLADLLGVLIGVTAYRVLRRRPARAAGSGAAG